MKKKLIIRFAGFVLAALVLTGLAGSSILSSLNNTLSDTLYQQPQALDGNVILVGIDQRAVEDLGRFQDWGRDVLAQAIEALNADPENRPAAIGIDVLFTGDTDPELDAYLAEAAGAYGNVVTATTATFGSQPVENEDGTFYVDDFFVLSYEEPYEALKQATRQGHINAMLDHDGILRHALFQVNLPDGTPVPSFHSQLYRMYAEHVGLDPDVRPPMNSRSIWYVPFSAMPGGYDEGISVADLLDGSVSSDAFADKIVIIGPYTIGLQDSYLTAIDHASYMYGMEYQANAIDALIRGEFKTEVPELPQQLILFTVSLLCLLWFWSRRVLWATLTWLGLSAGWVGICAAAWEMGYVLDVMYLPLSVTVLFVVTVALNYIREALAKKKITSTFKKYVAPEIVTEILKEGQDELALGGKLTDIAVLFVDIRGFTSMSESLEPTEVVEILNRYLTLTSTSILENGGTLDKFVGDCTMAFWGAPLPQEDCIYKAVKTGLDMVAGAKAMAEELTERFGRAVDFGVGVHYGPAVVGNIGAPIRMDYTAIGDTVNTASRLESNAAGGQILVSRTVADALEGRMRFTSLGDSIRLKGKAAGFEVLRVEGLAEDELAGSVGRTENREVSE